MMRIAGARHTLATAVMVTVLAVLAVAASVRSGQAQVHRLEELPWPAVADTSSRRGLVVSWQQALDPHTDWRSDRLGLVLTVPVADRSVFFVRGGFLRLDTAGLTAAERWPDLLADDEGADVPADWPGERTSVGFDRPEVGLLVPLALPGIGAGRLGLMAGIPMGRDRLYPFSAPCLPLVAEWRRTWSLGDAALLAARVGFEQTLASSRDVLDGDAFPSGLRYALTVGSAEASVRGLRVGWSARELSGGHHERQARLVGWTPLAGGHRLELHVTRDLGGRADRAAAWTLGLAWRLRGLPRDDDTRDRDGSSASGRQNATPPSPGR
jgi:hypothetical protein